jgi:hypothetical protein
VHFTWRPTCVSERRCDWVGNLVKGQRSHSGERAGIVTICVQFLMHQQCSAKFWFAISHLNTKEKCSPYHRIAQDAPNLSNLNGAAHRQIRRAQTCLSHGRPATWQVRHEASCHCGGPGSVPRDFNWDSRWTMWQWSSFSSEFFCFPQLITFSPLLHTHLSPPHELCDNSHQAAHYHTLGPHFRAKYAPYWKIFRIKCANLEEIYFNVAY